MGCNSSSPKKPSPTTVVPKPADTAASHPEQQQVTFSKGRAVPRRDFSADYKMEKRLGKGNYSEVRLATHRRTKAKRAIKVVTKATLQQEDLDALYVEVEVLLKLDHPHVVNLFAFYEDDSKFYLVMELMTGGELFQRIIKKAKYTEAEARETMRTLVKALNYCHEQGVMHRDLKPENVLLDSEEEDASIKIADFGFAKKFDYSSEHAFQTSCGTPGYVAPEIINKSKYGREVDIWSLGVIFYILLCGYPPFMANNMSDLFRQIRKARYDFDDEGWADISAEAKDLISKILVVDPKKRLTAEQILSHQWMTQQRVRTLQLTKTMYNLKAFEAQQRVRNAFHVVRVVKKMQVAGGPTLSENEGDEAAAEAEAQADDAAAAAAAAAKGAGAGAGAEAGAEADAAVAAAEAEQTEQVKRAKVLVSKASAKFDQFDAGLYA